MTKITTWAQLSKVRVGAKLRIVKTITNQYLPVGFIAEVAGMEMDYVTLFDKASTKTRNSTCDICDYEIANGAFSFELVTTKDAPATKTTLAKRKAAAKAIRKAEKDLIALIEDAVVTLGLTVEYTSDIVITYDAPTETY